MSFYTHLLPSINYSCPLKIHILHICASLLLLSISLSPRPWNFPITQRALGHQAVLRQNTHLSHISSRSSIAHTAFHSNPIFILNLIFDFCCTSNGIPNSPCCNHHGNLRSPIDDASRTRIQNFRLQFRNRVENRVRGISNAREVNLIK